MDKRITTRFLHCKDVGFLFLFSFEISKYRWERREQNYFQVYLGELIERDAKESLEKEE